MVVKTILIVVIVLIVLYFLLGFIIAYCVSNSHVNVDMFFPKPKNDKEREIDEKSRNSADIISRRVDKEYDLMNKEGIKLHGYLVKGEAASNVYVFYSHGYRAPYAGFECGIFADMWLQKGYNLFIVDHRGSGKSEGNWVSFGQYETEDSLEWLEFMKKEFGDNIQIILHGESMGCTIALMMSDKEKLPKNVKMVLADCGYTDFYHEALAMVHMPNFIEIPLLKLTNLYLRIFANVNMHESDARSAVQNTEVPILFMHGDDDTVVPLNMTKENYEACSSDVKELHVFSGATHERSLAYHPEEYTKAVYNFTDRFIK